MDRITEYLETVSLTTVGGSLCLAMFVYFLIPLRYRLEVTLATMVLTLTLGRLPEIGVIANAAKICSGFPFLAVSLAAFQHPGKRAKLPLFLVGGYLTAGILGVVLVSNTLDADFAIILRVQWLLLAISAILTARTVVNSAALEKVLKALFIGMSLSCLITLSALIIDPVAAYQSGFGRFQPFDCNSNQIGVLFAVTAGLGLYFSLKTKSSTTRTLFVFFTVVATGQSILSVSRASFLILALSCFPSFFVLFRRPIFAVLSCGVATLVIISLLGMAGEAEFERLDRGISSRTEKTSEVFPEIAERIWFGVGFTEGINAYEVHFNAHNAYVMMLYLGGLCFAGPLFANQAIAYVQMLIAWFNKHKLPIDPHLTSVLTGLATALLLHGFINDMAYYPTYTWAFLNVFLAAVSTILVRNLIRTNNTLRNTQRVAATAGLRGVRS